MTAGSLHHSPGWADHQAENQYGSPGLQAVRPHGSSRGSQDTAPQQHRLPPLQAHMACPQKSSDLRTHSQLEHPGVLRSGLRVSDHQTPVWQGSWKINKYVEIKNTPIDKWFKGKSKGHQNIAGVKGRWGRPQAK